MAPKTPRLTSRGFTVAEARSLTFEKVSLWAVMLVAGIAAVISFVALTYVGARMGLGFAAWLIPVAIDGFAIACSFGVIRSQGVGEGGRERLNEWVGLMLALALSVAGNVWHVLEARDPSIPAGLAAVFAAAIPVFLAYGIHIYGRSMQKGISAHVMADAPDELRLDVQSLAAAHETLAAHDAPTSTARRVTTRAPRLEPTRAPQPGTARATTPEPPRTSTGDARAPEQPARTVEGPERAPADASTARAVVEAARAQSGDDLVIDEVAYRARYEELYRAALAADPYTQPVSSRLYVEAGQTKRTDSAVRRWGTAMWAEHQKRMEREGLDFAVAPGDEEDQAAAEGRVPASV